MSVLYINEAWNKGLLGKASKIILPVQEREITLSKEETGVYGEQKLSTEGIGQCHCISTGKMENGMLKIIGEAMPVYLILKGEIGVRRGPMVLHYTCSMLFDLPQGISARHITLHDWKKYKKRLELTATLIHWLATNKCVNFYSSNAYFNVFFVDSGDVDAYGLYDSYGNANSPCDAVRPVYYLPIHNPNIKIEVPDEGEERRLILP